MQDPTPDQQQEQTNIGTYDGGFERGSQVHFTPEKIAQHRQLDDDFERPLGKGENDFLCCSPDVCYESSTTTPLVLLPVRSTLSLLPFSGSPRSASLIRFFAYPSPFPGGPHPFFHLDDVFSTCHFGKVYLARVRSRTDPFILVLKCLTKDEIITKQVQTQVRREIEVMQTLRHPNIIRLYGWFHDSERIFLMLELAGKGELFKQLAKKGKFSEKRSSQYIRQVASGLAYLHSNDIIHRDIKPENLLLGMNGEIKIGDFGWSVYSPAENRPSSQALYHILCSEWREAEDR
uniref:AUR protein kinase n=1 Tax=Kwoniella dejecticola CBS 10117 TaxID=1296121 RepID=A0A1A6AGY9_9TREE|nr:AUR protein kinase [Kwoniella dejecticola CBS 10117]OBR89350.1 AUR protein kinase [Kwoniella dejecticola CBS 10117]